MTDLCEQLIPLIRYQGIRRAALLTRPLVFDNPKSNIANTSNLIPLDWNTDTLPLLNQYLQDLPKVRVDIHLPKSIVI
ncbi:hypothetical protein [Psychrobacter sp. P2G3]|uniref:hypothetical protein n=1 Tax=Psychrobacter sp. P2G3 TaxID=1699622 RepID=UPI000A6F418B|nr:hypothetical protein [Psychrobacter sp. P2G3]